MSSKPVVTLAMRAKFPGKMFAPRDMTRLGQQADVRGPVNEIEDPEFISAIKDSVVAFACWGSPRFDARVLDHASKLKMLAYAAGSVKGVVSEALFDRGIKVSSSADAMAPFVAEYTVSMMVAMLKQVPWLTQIYPKDLSHQSEEFKERFNQLRELFELNIGLIGASRIGRHVIRLLKGYQSLRVKVYDPYLKPEDAKNLGVELVSLDDVCRCEVVSCHAPNVPATRHMLNAQNLALLPDHAVFINTSRGALIDEEALVAEVRRRPLYVLLDVTDPEPPRHNSPLLSHPNIVLMPHVGGAVGQGHCALGRMAIDEAIRFLSGQPLEHEVTRQMLPILA